MLGSLKKTSSFFIPYFILLLTGVCYFFYLDHGDFVLWMNGLHGPVFNFFFKYWTYTGDGFFIAAITLLVIILRRRYGLILGLVAIVQGLATLLFKQVLFTKVPRPFKYFEGKQMLDLIEGVKVHDFNSFPSGHTMTAFALATFVALMLKNRRYSVLLLIGAMLTGISRVYLGHHFLIDIMAGSLVGVIVATGFYIGFEKYLTNATDLPRDEPDKDLSEMDISAD